MDRLRFCREQKGMSQKQVALEIGVKAPTVSQWESGIKKPSRDNLAKLADLFGVTADYLMEREESIDSDSTLSYSFEEITLISLYRKLNRENKKSIQKNIRFLLDDQEKEKENRPSAG